MAEEKLVENAAAMGRHLLAGLEAMQRERPEVLSNARGKGLMCAVDFPDAAVRDAVAERAFELGAIILPCGRRSLRFRPPLDITAAELDEGLDLIGRAIALATARSA
jgi:L-lysine 6-transaminase